MWTYDRLLDETRELDHTRVLTVYLSRQERDPGQEGLWRRRLDRALAEERSRVGGEEGAEALEHFDRAAEAVTSATEAFGRVLPFRGWWACATTDGLCHGGGLPFEPPTLARWRQGVFLAPYVRGLKGMRTVLVGLVDRRRARLFTFRDGRLEPLRTLGADTDVLDMSDVGASKRASATTGTRGETRTDAAKHALDEIARRLRDRVAHLLVEGAGADGTVLVGGAKAATAALARALAPELAGRLLDLPDVPVDADEEELVRHVEAAASKVTSRRQFELLDQARGTGGIGSVGWNDTLTALRGGAVDTLLLSRELIGTAPDDAEELVRLALSQRADVEELGGELGSELQEHHGGVAARLRFRVPA